MTSITHTEHSTHPHRLILKRDKTAYRCYGCKELSSDPCYQCNNESPCDFHLHEECAAENHTSTNHPFIGSRSVSGRCFLSSKTKKLIFHKTISDRSVGLCVACGKDVRGYRYQSFCKKALVLHPHCLNLPRDMKNDEVSLMLKKKAPFKCLKCQRKKVLDTIHGWAYASTCGTYCYHVACVKELILENWKDAYFNPQTYVGNQNTLSLIVHHQSLAGRKAGKINWPMAKEVLQLIVTAIFGSVVPGIVSLVVQSCSS